MLRPYSLICAAALGACASSAAPRREQQVACLLNPGLVARLARPAGDAGSDHHAPRTPALRALEGRVPLLYLSRGPWSAAKPYEPVYALAVYDDGTVAYEGHRCVKVGGLLLTRLQPDEVDQLKQQLASACTDLRGWNDDELCGDGNSLRIICSNGTDVLAGTDRCRHEQDEGKRVAELAGEVVAELKLAPWLGEPTARQACEPGARDLAPREISLTLGPSLAAARSFAPFR